MGGFPTKPIMANQVDSPHTNRFHYGRTHPIERPHRRFQTEFASADVFNNKDTDQKNHGRTKGAMNGTLSNQSPRNNGPFTQPLSTTSFHNAAPGSTTKSSAWAPANPLLSTPTRPTNTWPHFYSNTQPRKESDYVLLGSSDLGPSEPDCVLLGSKDLEPSEPDDGREVDKPAVIDFFDRATRRRETMAKKQAELDIRNWLSPIPQPPAQASKKGAAAGKSRTEPIVISDTSDLSSEPSKKTKGKAPETSSNASSSPSSAKPRPPPKSSAAPRPQSKSEKAQPPFSPIFAKQLPLKDSDVPPDVDRDFYVAHLNRVPEPTDIICSCKKPARTPDVAIAQCINTDCPVGWYHRDCLDKNIKLQTRYGTTLCQQCRTDKEFRDKDKKNGWTAETMAQTEMQIPWTKTEIMATLPGPGEVTGVANPYGLATEVPVTTEQVQQTPEQPPLGELVFMGYQASRPHVVTEAYTNAREYEYDNADLYDMTDDEEKDGEEDDSATLVHENENEDEDKEMEE